MLYLDELNVKARHVFASGTTLLSLPSDNDNTYFRTHSNGWLINNSDNSVARDIHLKRHIEA